MAILSRFHDIPSVAPERTDVDTKAQSCQCGSQPLMTHTGGMYYMSCAQCWVRTHKSKTPEIARHQWDLMATCFKRVQ